MHWNQLASGLWLYPDDSCNVYAVAGSGAEAGVTVINAGTGAWISHTSELPLPVKALACTHYFRDHSAGASKAAEAGMVDLGLFSLRNSFAYRGRGLAFPTGDRGGLPFAPRFRRASGGIRPYIPHPAFRLLPDL